MMTIDVGERQHWAQLDAAKALARERRLVALGLAAWSLRRYAKGEIAASEANDRLAHLLPQLGDVPSLWELVLDAIDHDVSEEMGWSNWILFEKKNMGRAMFLDTDSHLWRAFLIAAVRRAGSGGALRFTPSEAGRDAARIEDGVFWRTFREIQEDSKQIWQPLLEGVERGPALDAISGAVRTALREQEAIDVDELIASPIADDTVARVATEVVEGWKKNGVLRKLIEAAGAHKFESGPAPTGSHFGIFRLERKDIYVPDSRLHSDGWGDGIGRGLAHGENAAIVKSILSVASASPKEREGEANWKEGVRAAIAHLRKTHAGDQSVVLLVNASMAAWRLTSESGFKRMEGPRDFAIGSLDDASVFEIHVDDEKSVALVTSLKHVGEWRQYTPNQKLHTEREIARGLLFGIAEIAPEEAERMISEDPGLLDRLGAATKEAGIRELRQTVLLRLMEAFQYQIADPGAAIKISIPDEP